VVSLRPVAAARSETLTGPADYISAIDNTTRKLLSDGKRPLGTGF
jgi:hypothetical protein